jgi:hypothetical protein
MHGGLEPRGQEIAELVGPWHGLFGWSPFAFAMDHPRAAWPTPSLFAPLPNRTFASVLALGALIIGPPLVYCLLPWRRECCWIAIGHY